MSESNTNDAFGDNKESTPAVQDIELFESLKEDAVSVMRDAKGAPKYVYALAEKITVGIDPVTHDGANSGRVTHIDPEAKRAWILYRMPGRTRPGYGWVLLADLEPAITYSLKNDLRDIDNEDTVEFIVSGVNSAALELVDGKMQVTAREHILPYEHPKYPYIKGIRRLTKPARGICIYSKTAKQHVAATVSFVDSELDYFLAEYFVEGQNMHKWLAGDAFTPELAIKRD